MIHWKGPPTLTPDKTLHKLKEILGQTMYNSLMKGPTKNVPSKKADVETELKTIYIPEDFREYIKNIQKKFDGTSQQGNIYLFCMICMRMIKLLLIMCSCI